MAGKSANTSPPRRPGPSAKANEGCAATGIESHLRGSFPAAGLGKNAFHRWWPMTWRGRPQAGIKSLFSRVIPRKSTPGPPATLGSSARATIRQGALKPELPAQPPPNDAVPEE
jgi:hypothetical protein